MGGHGLKEFYDFINQAEAYENNHGFFKSNYTKKQWNILTMQFEAMGVELKEHTFYVYNCFFQSIFNHFKENDGEIIIYGI